MVALAEKYIIGVDMTAKNYRRIILNGYPYKPEDQLGMTLWGAVKEAYRDDGFGTEGAIVTASMLNEYCEKHIDKYVWNAKENG